MTVFYGNIFIWMLQKNQRGLVAPAERVVWVF